MSGKFKQCPICWEQLVIVDVAPCDDCGWNEIEIQHFKEKKHTYSKFNIYGSELILCNFCDVDFTSYDPRFWGFPGDARVGYGSKGFQKAEEIPYEELQVKKDRFCPSCSFRLTFLNALAKIREFNNEQ